MALLIRSATLVLPERVVDRGWLLVQGAHIQALGEGEPPPELTADDLIDRPGLVVLPGLVNAHTHLEQTFMRGYTAERSLLDWLRLCVWPLQSAMTAEDVQLAATLGMVEAVRGGATTIVDHHKVPLTPQHTDGVLSTAAQLGVRLVLARGWADQGEGAEPLELIEADLVRLFDEWHGAAEGRIQIANGPLALWRCSAEGLQRTTAIARERSALTHAHVSETQAEVVMSLRQTRLRPIEWLHALGVLGADFHAVHAVWLSDPEIRLLQQTGARVTHCPAANMLLASGVAPIARLVRLGVRVALATDGPASNDTQDLFEAMRQAVFLHRVVSLDPQALSPRQALSLACQLPHGGEAALRPGAPADLVLVDFNAAHIQPVGDVLASLVFNVRNSDVWGVVVNGQVILRERRFVALDEAALIAECRDRAAHLARRAGVHPGAV